jgi:transcriptional regulator with XRE-family HTH domain
MIPSVHANSADAVTTTPSLSLRSEVHGFLLSRRRLLTPDAVGLVVHDEHRRVAGLRRDEVATLAGMSIHYYRQLERGNLRGASDAVLDAVAAALRLDDAEIAYLRDLARASNASLRPARYRRPELAQLTPAITDLVDAIQIPAYIRNSTFDVLGANAAGRDLFPHLFEAPIPTSNFVRSLFLDPRSRDFWVDWDSCAAYVAAEVRTEYGHHPFDPGVSALITQLLAGSEHFRALWQRHEVHLAHDEIEVVRHPTAGELTVHMQPLAVPTVYGPAFDSFTVASFRIDGGLQLHPHAIETVG